MLARLYQGGYFKPQAPYELSRRNHPRTLRKARENVKWMVADGVSRQKTRNYLHRFVNWWARTVENWTYETLLESFIQSCWTRPPAAIAEYLIQRRITELHTDSRAVCPNAA